jgi:hypothetical protein
MRDHAASRISVCDVMDTKHLQALALQLQTIEAVERIFVLWVQEGDEVAKRAIQDAEEPPSIFKRFSRNLR